MSGARRPCEMDGVWVYMISIYFSRHRVASPVYDTCPRPPSSWALFSTRQKVSTGHRSMHSPLQGTECPICFEIRALVATPCGHRFCAACIKEALARRACCPICCRYARVAEPGGKTLTITSEPPPEKISAREEVEESGDCVAGCCACACVVTIIHFLFPIP